LLVEIQASDFSREMNRNPRIILKWDIIGSFYSWEELDKLLAISTTKVPPE
jgi:hypothetical protein